MPSPWEVALPRTIKIGNASIGLLGLDQALAKVLADPALGEAQAVEALLAAIGRDNYIPTGSEPAYRQALGHLYRQLSGREPMGEALLVIRILGKACLGCNNLEKTVLAVLQRLGVAADVESIHDPDEIWRHGVLTTPALMINGEIRAAGRLPTPAQVEAWIRAALMSKADRRS
ncbi:MAG: thioredoxin family protein [Thermodesulfobacteriota bacterium]